MGWRLISVKFKEWSIPSKTYGRSMEFWATCKSKAIYPFRRPPPHILYSSYFSRAWLDLCCAKACDPHLMPWSSASPAWRGSSPAPPSTCWCSSSLSLNSPYECQWSNSPVCLGCRDSDCTEKHRYFHTVLDPF